MSKGAPAVPDSMQASVYRGQSRVRLEEVPVPAAGPGELLVRVEACGVCHTDLKKIEYNLFPPPRIYGHETAGVVVQAGSGVTDFAPGDRVCLFHHIPCLNCFYCRHGNYAQCATYKRVGVTAGFEPAGGGFAQYVRVMDWIVRRGVVKMPDNVSFDRASFVEPVNTCLKAVKLCRPQPDESVLVVGQGPIGLIFTMLLRRSGLERIYTTDVIPARLAASSRLGACETWNPTKQDVASQARRVTTGRGADLVIVAASGPGVVEQAVEAARSGGRVMLFAQTSPKEVLRISGAAICAEERTIFGSYSASVDCQEESAEIVWKQDFPVEELISHRLSLGEVNRGIELARRPVNGSLKLIVCPQN